MSSCTLLILGHLPSADNLAGLRSRDQDVAASVAEQFERDLAPALPLLRVWVQLAVAVYAPATRRHMHSAQMISALLDAPAPIIDARLNNIDYGMFKGLPLAATPSGSAYVTQPYSGGTSWSYVLGCWRSFSTEVLQRHAADVVLLAGQSGAAARMLEVLCAHRPLSDVLDDPCLDVPFLGEGGQPRAVWEYTW